jgi:Fe-S-cluster containining protein
MHTINTIDQLKQAMWVAWAGIEDDCRCCDDPDCLGYTWILPEEEEALLDRGVQTVQINGDEGPMFLDSYLRDDQGELIVWAVKPPCRYRHRDGTCDIHEARPLVCHMYPLGLKTVENKVVVWALHGQCRHVRRRRDAGEMNAVILALATIIDRMAPELRARIYAEYAKVDAVSYGELDDEYEAVAVVTTKSLELT